MCHDCRVFTPTRSDRYLISFLEKVVLNYRLMSLLLKLKEKALLANGFEILRALYQGLFYIASFTHLHHFLINFV
jgi:hypothetical protein